VDLSGVLEAIARIAEIEAGAQRAPAGFAPLLELAAPELASADVHFVAPQQVPFLAPPSSGERSWVDALPPQGRKFAEAIERAARAAGLDPRLLAALVWTESGFRPDAVSTAGAVGLTQLMPRTAAGLGVDPYDPIQNLEGGARYLAAQIRRFGSLELGLAAYVAGPGAVAAAGGIPSASAAAYVRRVLEHLGHLGGGPAALAPRSAGRVVAARATSAEIVQGRANAAQVVDGLVDGRATAEAVTGRAASAEAVTGRAASAEATAGSIPGASIEGAVEHRTDPPGAGAVRSREARDRTGAIGLEPLEPPHGSTLTESPSPSTAPLVPEEPSVRAAAPSTVGRVLEVVERIRDQAPPRRVVVELPEMDGLRVLVEARATTVHVRPVGGDPSGVWYEALVRDLGPGLAARGFDLADRSGGGGAFRDRPEDPQVAAGPSPVPVVRIRSEGVRL
jgi:hypothetical protein